MAAGKGLVMALAAAAAATVAFLSGKKSASAATSQTPLVAPTAAASPPNIAARMVAVLASGDPVQVRAEAAKLRKEGFEAQARDLENAAAALDKVTSVINTKPAPPPGERPPPVVSPPIAVPPVVPPPAAIPASLANQGVTSVSPGQPTGSISSPPQNPLGSLIQQAGQVLQTSGVTLPTQVITPLPGVIPPTAPAPPPDAKRLVAAQTVQAVKGKKKGQENQTQVRLYQAQEQPDAGSIDGKWGFKTAASVIKYGLVPPPPLYWVGPAGRTWDVQLPKQEWRALMLQNAARDPQRAEEWTAAAKV